MKKSTDKNCYRLRKDNIEKYQFLQQVVMTIANTEMKLVSTSAPKEYNDKIKAALTYLEQTPIKDQSF